MSHWRESQIGDEIELAYGKSLPSHARGTGAFKVYGSNGCVGTHSSSWVSGPGIVIGRKGSLGKVVYSEEDFWPIDTTYYVVNRNGHNWRFLYHLLSYTGLDELNSHSAVPGLNRETAYAIPIALPDKAEQEEIASVLDTIEHAIQREGLALENSQNLKNAAMHVLFTRGLRGEPQRETDVGPVPVSWELKPISDQFAVVSGGTPSRRVREFWMNGTIPWVKTTEIDYCLIKETEEYITPAGLEQSAAKILHPGTLLLAMYGQGVTRGKVAILGIDAACNQACAAITPNAGAVDSKYLYHFLVFRYESIRQLAHGGQQQNLNLEIVRNFLIAIPPDKATQDEIVGTLDAIDRKIDLHRRKRAVLKELFKALSHKLMTGEVRTADLLLGENSASSITSTIQPEPVGDHV